ncbi:hypothetical protein GCM10010172_06690 [Paractinoplanes ferrugineus]|uniref:Uncharacterized protein n=1 Tax=Paractinoplanes ferrugineus TaxID=113564 RepID=A0A919JAX9_9ACTN|nr:hypothetical protein [Actinoplanes ferrugineus]GIE16303.1 hypothetical protein Afe05nite_81430 [Actinoplanes ferrugineus]
MSSTTLIGDGRELRICDACGGVDDHPRHVIDGQQPSGIAIPELLVDAIIDSSPQGERSRLLADLYDRTTLQLHRDCCRSLGCPNGDCDELTQGAEELRGSDLLAHLAGLQAKEAQR